MINARSESIAESMEFVNLELWKSTKTSELVSLESNEALEFVDGTAKTLKTLISNEINLPKETH